MGLTLSKSPSPLAASASSSLKCRIDFSLLPPAVQWEVSQLGSTQWGAFGEDKRHPEAGRAGHVRVRCAPLVARCLCHVSADSANVTPVLQDEETALPSLCPHGFGEWPRQTGKWVEGLILWCQWPADSSAGPDKLSDFRAWDPAAPFLPQPQPQASLPTCPASSSQVALNAQTG